MLLKVFSTPSCGFCVQLKSYLQQKGIAFQEVDLSQDPEQAQGIIQLTGQMGVPVLVREYEGTGRNPDFLVGFSASRVDAFLAQNLS